jgi:hypothetical protein
MCYKVQHGIFFYLVCEAIGTAATPGLLCQPRVIVKMIVEKQLECRLARETEVLGENLPQRHFCPSQNHTWPDPGLNPGRRGGKPATNRLSYGAAYSMGYGQERRHKFTAENEEFGKTNTRNEDKLAGTSTEDAFRRSSQITFLL